MKIDVRFNIEETAKAAAEKIILKVKKNPKATITYATGNTMIPVYQKLAEAVSKKEVDFSQTKAFHLDEYYPCSPDEPHSFVNYLQQYVFSPFKISPKNCFAMNGIADDADAEAARYNDLLSKYPVDLAILGIGPGSHIGFNEGGTPFNKETHLVALSKETVARDQVERQQNTPTQAITQGIANILAAKEILLIAYGAEKGDYLEPAINGKISPECPASALRLSGEKVTILIDKSAANQLSKWTK